MKKIFGVLMAITCTAVIFYSCTKNNNDTILTEAQAVDKLLQSESFVEFSKDFVPDLVDLMQYHRSASVQLHAADFMQQIKLAGDDENRLSAVYKDHSLNFDRAVIFKNKLDNDMLGLFNKNKFLLTFSDAQIQNIMLSALDAARTSPDPKWKSVKAAVDSKLGSTALSGTLRVGMQGVKTNLVDVGTGQPGITWDEIWDCMKRAVGLGSAGVLGVAALKKLASEGVQQVVITLSKFLAKRLGWFGLIITLADLGSCVYHEAQD